MAELPGVTPIAKRFVEQAGAADRVSVVAADMVDGQLSGSYDVVAMCSFIQVLSPDEARRALVNVGKVIEPGGDIYIFGRVPKRSASTHHLLRHMFLVPVRRRRASTRNTQTRRRQRRSALSVLGRNFP